MTKRDALLIELYENAEKVPYGSKYYGSVCVNVSDWFRSYCFNNNINNINMRTQWKQVSDTIRGLVTTGKLIKHDKYKYLYVFTDKGWKCVQKLYASLDNSNTVEDECIPDESAVEQPNVSEFERCMDMFQKNMNEFNRIFRGETPKGQPNVSEDYEKQITDLEHNNTKLYERIATLEGSNEKLQSKIDYLQGLLNDRDAIINTLNKKLEAVYVHEQDLCKQLNTANAKNEALKNNFKKISDAYVKMTAWIDAMANGTAS